MPRAHSPCARGLYKKKGAPHEKDEPTRIPHPYRRSRCSALAGVTVGYGYDEEEGKRLWMQTRAALLARYPGSACEVELLQIGCTIAVHTGPYALGMGVMRRWKKQ